MLVSRVVHCSPLASVERVNCQAVFLDTAGPFQLTMWKKMMHVLHTSEWTGPCRVLVLLLSASAPSAPR